MVSSDPRSCTASELHLITEIVGRASARHPSKQEIQARNAGISLQCQSILVQTLQLNAKPCERRPKGRALTVGFCMQNPRGRDRTAGYALDSVRIVALLNEVSGSQFWFRSEPVLIKRPPIVQAPSALILFIVW